MAINNHSKFERVQLCQCNRCVYMRWYKRKHPKGPRPVPVKGEPKCSCKRCLQDRLKAANTRVREWRAEAQRLRALMEEQADRRMDAYALERLRDEGVTR